MDTEKKYKKAVLWESEGKKVRCFLCAWKCLIDEGKFGVCGVRKNVDGQLFSLNFDEVCAANSDPIEKKPLFHFKPETMSFSVACVGCNMRCDFCQNWHISQQRLEKGKYYGQPIRPDQIVQAAVGEGCQSIAYTYTEPTIFMELAAETAKLAKEHGLANVFVSNGFMTPQTVDFVNPWLDAINIDLKAFNPEYYQHLCHARLQPVLDTIKYIAQKTNIWLELTTLIIPGENDSDDELKRLTDFIAKEAGPLVPWHISRFYPQYKMTDKDQTPIDTLQRAAEIGKEAGLKYIYIGNVPGGGTEDTMCHNCAHLLIERVGYKITQNLLKNAKCPKCNTPIPGVWV
jgi:pyruvate formate lyase activating enzyme